MKIKMYYRGISLVLLLALSVSMLGSVRSEAAAPAKPAISIGKRTKTKATIKIKKKGNVSGYQVYMKSSKNGKFQLIMGIKTSSYTIKKLKANKTYYVKVRAFRTKGYHITFGKYSAVLKITPYQKSETKPSETPKPVDSPEPSVEPLPPIISDPIETPSPSGTPEPVSTEDTIAALDAE